MALPLSFIGSFFLLLVLLFIGAWLSFRWRQWLDREDAAAFRESQDGDDLGGTESEGVPVHRVATIKQYFTMVFFGFGMAFPMVPTDIPHYTRSNIPKIGAIVLIFSCQFVLSPSDIEGHLRDNMHALEGANPCNEARKLMLLGNITHNVEVGLNIKEARNITNDVMDFQRSLEHDVGLYGVGDYECISKHGVPGTNETWAEQFTEQPFFTQWCVEEAQAELFSIPGETSCPHDVGKVCADKKVLGMSIPEYWRCVDGGTVDLPCSISPEDMASFLGIERQQREAEEARKASKAMQTEPPKSDLAAWLEEAKKYEYIVDDMKKALRVASFLYSAYEIYVLIRTMPLVILYEPLSQRVQKSFLSMPKAVFVPAVASALLAAYYAYPLMHGLELLEIHLTFVYALASINPDPCYLDLRFDKQVADTVVGMCQELSVLEVNYNLALQDADAMLAQVHFFSTGSVPCNCELPMEELCQYTPDCGEDGEETTHRFPSFVKDFNFSDQMNSLGVGTLYVPNKTAPFPGSALCKDPVKLLNTALGTDVYVNWIEELLRSAILLTVAAQFLFSTLVTVVLKLVDPLCIYGGEYMAPTASIHQRPATLAFRTKLHLVELLRAEASLMCVVLGVPLLIIFANLAWTFADDLFDCKASITSRDSIIGFICIGVGVAMLLGTPYAVSQLRKRFMFQTSRGAEDEHAMVEESPEDSREADSKIPLQTSRGAEDEQAMVEESAEDSREADGKIRLQTSRGAEDEHVMVEESPEDSRLADSVLNAGRRALSQLRQRFMFQTSRGAEDEHAMVEESPEDSRQADNKTPLQTSFGAEDELAMVEESPEDSRGADSVLNASRSPSSEADRPCWVRWSPCLLVLLGPCYVAALCFPVLHHRLDRDNWKTDVTDWCAYVKDAYGVWEYHGS